MRTGLFRLAMFFLPLLLLACGELPTAPSTVDLASVNPLFSGDCVRNPDGSVTCKPLVSDNPCEIYDCGGDDDPCMTSTADPLSADGATMQSGCPPPGDGGGEPIGGGGDGGDGNSGGTGGGSGGSTTKPPPVELEADSCKTQDQMIDDLDVQQAFKDFWAASGLSLSQEQRREQGGWIFADPSGGYMVVPFAAELERTPCSIELPVTPPAGALGYIHTHPFRVGELVTVPGCLPTLNGKVYPVRFLSGSSDADDQVQSGYKAQGYNLRAYVIDANTIIQYDGSGIPQNERTYGRCGY
jgi:hypothetical protein